jgi:hypothetical protein
MAPKRIFAAVLVVSFFAEVAASATTNLPYVVRTQPYSGYFSTVHGDTRTVGMAGATVGLADTFIASLDNPSGLAMTLGVGDDTFSSDKEYDSHVQSSEDSMSLNDFGVAFGAYPWGFSLGYVSPYREDASYFTAADPNDAAELDTTVREFHLGVARVFFNDRLSLGGNLIVGQAERAMQFPSSPAFNAADHSYGVSGTLGAMYQWPNHVLLGVSYTTPVNYSASTTPTPGLPGFFEPIEVPWKIGMGVGYIPNRFFRADFTLLFVGPTFEATLLKDNAVSVGQYATMQPRLGAAYLLADYKEFSANLFGGAYYEVTRIDGSDSRIHGTGGLELKPWIFTVGWAFDTSAGYNNYLFSISVDVFKVLAKLDFIPQPAPVRHEGVLPNPKRISDLGLPRPLVRDWIPHGPDINPLDVAKNMPAKIQQKVQEIGKTVDQIFSPKQDAPLLAPDAVLPGAKKLPRPQASPMLTVPGQ